MSDVLIRNAHIVDPFNNIDRNGDLLFSDGVIKAIGDGIGPSDGCNIIDADGLYAIPGLVDMHVHLRDPGFCAKEDILSGCRAAAAGGVTSVACMPNTSPVIDNPQTLEYIFSKAKDASAHVYPIAAVTKGLESGEVCDIAQMARLGAVAVSDDGRPVATEELLAEGITAADNAGILTISHCEDLELVRGGIINEGEISKKLGVKGMPRESEDNSTLREITVAERLDKPIHIAHVSTKGSCEIIRQAKKRGVKVTCETAPHYFILTDKELLKKDANYRMNPPLRTEEDRLAIIEAIKDGTIDAIATDHAPHTPEEKSDFYKSPNGIVGLETSFALGLNYLVDKGYISLNRLIELMSVNPAKLLHLNAGTLSVGAPADIVLFDKDAVWTVDKNKLHGKSRNTPFDGFELKGRAVLTVCGGKTVYDIKTEE